VPSYSAGKAAIHSLAWCFRAQLADEYPNLKVIEIIPPAVMTELHTLQGKQAFGMPLGEFTDEAWRGLVEGEEEITVGMAEQMAGVEQERRAAFDRFTGLVKGQSSAASVFAAKKSED
jgi:short-subunit dehydrogenase involved in D-alanine esterification of teichoic acids